MAIPKWLNDILVADSVPAWAPKPSMNDVVRRVGVRDPQMSAEDYLRMLARDAQAAREVATRSADSALSADANVFGLPVKTIEQGRSLGERNLPGIENLSPEDQIALATALDKGAMLRAMPALGSEPTIRRRPGDQVLPSFRVIPSDRLRAITGADEPYSFLADVDPSIATAMNTLQNKSDFRRLSGMSASTADLPNPSAYRGGPTNYSGEFQTAAGPQALGPDIPELLRQVRDDQIDSRMLTIDETNKAMQQAELDLAMRESADAVAAREAYARQYGGFPPDTVRDMDRGVNRQRMIDGRVMEKLTGDERFNWARQMGGEMDPIVGSPLYPPSQKYAPSNYGSSAEFYWETEGKPLVKAMAAGHVLSYPLIYAGYQMLKPNDPAPARAQPSASQQDDLESWRAERERAIAESHKAWEEEKTRAFMDSLPDVPIDMNATQYRKGSIPSMPDVPIDLPDMPFVSMPQDEVGIPEDPMQDMILAEDGIEGAPVADDLPPPPTFAELDEELRGQGLSGVPAWYLKAMEDPSVTMIDGKPKREAFIFSPQSKEYATERKMRMAGMR